VKGDVANIRNKFFKSNIKLLKSYMAGVLVSVFAAILFLFPAPLEAITLRELGNAIASLDSEQEELIEKIIASETIVETRKNEIAALNEELQILNAQLEELSRQKEETAKSIENKKALLASKMIFTYKYGNNDVAKFIISAGDLNEIANNLFN